MKILLDTSPLNNKNSIRGVGAYTRFLSQELEKKAGIELLTQPPADKSKVDITHYPFFDLFFPTFPLIKQSKIVVTIHDVIPLLFPDQYKPGKKGKINYIRQKMMLLTNADAVITDSESSKKDINQYLKFNLNKIFAVPLAANPNLIIPSKEILNKTKTTLKLPDNYILYVGDINYNKNIPQLIKALKFLPDQIKLVCVGKAFVQSDIIEWQAIERQLALSNVEEKVIFINNLESEDNETLSAVYHLAKVYVQPSLYEGFGLPVLEAMQCKTAVVCSENSSLMEIGGNKVTFTKEDAESIAQAVQKILDLKVKDRQDIINKAYDYSQSFSWSKTANKTIQVYKKIL